MHFAVKMMNRNRSKSEGTTNTKSLCHVIDPRFARLLSRHSTKVYDSYIVIKIIFLIFKISPYRNDVDLQKMSNRFTETSISHLKFSPDAFLDSINKTSNQAISPVAEKSIITKFTSKVTRHRMFCYIYS
jgi:hypothetical protein